MVYDIRATLSMQMVLLYLNYTGNCYTVYANDNYTWIFFIFYLYRASTVRVKYRTIRLYQRARSFRI